MRTRRGHRRTRPISFDLLVSGPPPAPSEGLGPLFRSQKQRDFVAKTPRNRRLSMHSGHPSNSTTNPNDPDRPIDRPDRPGPSTTRPAHRPIAPPLSHTGRTTSLVTHNSLVVKACSATTGPCFHFQTMFFIALLTTPTEAMRPLSVHAALICDGLHHLSVAGVKGSR